MRNAITSILLVTALFATTIGCTTTTSTIVTALNAVSDAASVAVVVTSSLAAVGKVDPAVAAQVSDYAAGVTTAVQASIAELKTTDANPQKILVISSDFAKVAVPAFAGTNSAPILAVIDAVQTAVKNFLSQLNSNGVLTVAKAMPTKTVKLTSGDKTMLKEIDKKSTVTKNLALKLKVSAVTTK